MEIGPVICIDPVSRVIRHDKVLAFIQQLVDSGKSREDVNDALKFKTVVTSYGNDKHTYEVESIDFEQSPQNTFTQGKEPNQKEISYFNYFKERYGVTINDQSQPLIISKDRRTGKQIVLVPELCDMTGLTDEMRANFNLMRDLAQV